MSFKSSSQTGILGVIACARPVSLAHHVETVVNPWHSQKASLGLIVIYNSSLKTIRPINMDDSTVLPTAQYRAGTSFYFGATIPM
jgi:hypothetical protein